MALYSPSELFIGSEEEKGTEEKEREHASHQDARIDCDLVHYLFASWSNRLAFSRLWRQTGVGSRKSDL